MPAVARQAIHTGAQEKMRTQLPRNAEQFIYGALSIADVHATAWIIQQLGGLMQAL